MCYGISQERQSQSQNPSLRISLILRCWSARDRGPWIIWRTDPSKSQWSNQNRRLLLLPTTHLTPLLKVSAPFLTDDQTHEPGRFLTFLEWILWAEQYLARSTRAQGDSLSIWSRQFSLESNAIFLPFSSLQPQTSFRFRFSDFVPTNPMHLFHCVSWTLKKISVHTIHSLQNPLRKVGALHSIRWDGWSRSLDQYNPSRQRQKINLPSR